jgi:hypothetical protein
VIAQQRDELAAPFHLNQSIQHARAVGSTVDVVAQGNEYVHRPRTDRLDQGVQGQGAAVDVADRNGADRHRYLLGFGHFAD